MEKLLLLIPGKPSERLKKMIDRSTQGIQYEVLKNLDKTENLQNKKILFAVELGDTGINTVLYRMLEKISLSGASFMKNSVGSILINSDSELHTRDVARKIILYCNMAGCTFPGRPLCEAAGYLKNFKTQQKLSADLSLDEVCLNDSRNVVEKLINFKAEKFIEPKILVLHASNYKTSNTLSLWQMVKSNLDGCSINEIHIENGSVKDCKACSYKACKHYSQNHNCFYGGIMVEEVYPAIIDCDILIMLCPNYNDSISANLSAAINRLTALFRKVKFYDKYIYAIIVSGFSGSDILAQQLISAININKTFILPPNFALMETANDIGDIEKAENIKEKAKEFADNIKRHQI
ncbi:NAD(P)H-dependent oxidoreductase [Sedimentibacter hydroxybenzoicus DSM 7310]|uniref:NAD(P)H-dependent oxidoreductase n=1 Tax=Sedimentibacter hydroxybenzoicus DSM 7310 TaxID=1123245 RepID=A0A974GX55_SEDHY|nr:NAD(P)H-dependent oxidoreductase [Sedimentibacter hydroxybenzoicus]NYB75219.1 NAD(P)H-dependent oxidoreductase [Sedimentibacter hydroxybenzoicus DSM 7310]